MKLKVDTYTLQSRIFLIPCMSLTTLRDLSALYFSVAWIKWSFSVRLFMGRGKNES
jgi:hypothetical protein